MNHSDALTAWITHKIELLSLQQKMINCRESMENQDDDKMVPLGKVKKIVNDILAVIGETDKIADKLYLTVKDERNYWEFLSNKYYKTTLDQAEEIQTQTELLMLGDFASQMTKLIGKFLLNEVTAIPISRVFDNVMASQDPLVKTKVHSVGLDDVNERTEVIKAINGLKNLRFRVAHPFISNTIDVPSIDEIEAIAQDYNSGNFIRQLKPYQFLLKSGSLFQEDTWEMVT